MPRLLTVFLLLSALALGGYYLLISRTPSPSGAETAPAALPVAPDHKDEPAPPALAFTDITAAAGIDFVHTNGAYGDHLLPETMGGGLAFFDYDNDGDQDLLLVNSDHWPGHRPEGAEAPTQKLYANDGKGAFTDVTARSGLDITLYGMAPAVGDFDGDGWRDLYLTAVGENRLLRNDRGRFVDVTHRAGVAGGAETWSGAAAFFDYDRDGDLDLYVANYVQWSAEIDAQIDFRLTGVGRAYGPPTAFAGTLPYLFRNEGDGRFSDRTEAGGVAVRHPSTGAPMAKALAVIPLDADGDGWLDLFIANDTVQNFLLYNLGDGRFEERGTEWGVAFDRNGHATGAMGSDVVHYRNDAMLAIVVGNFANEMSSLYVTPGEGAPFSDDAIIEGIGAPSRRALSFGTLFFDYDLDGRPDLLQINGHIENEINRVQASQHYAQPPQLFWNCGGACKGTFVEVPLAQSGDLNGRWVGRGAAYADIDNDGDLDIAIGQTGGPVVLLRNDNALSHHWLRLRLQGRRGNRDAIGAQVTLYSVDGPQFRRVMPTRSYFSQVETVLTFGLGPRESVERIEVVWPDGSRQTLSSPAVDRLHTLRQPE